MSSLTKDLVCRLLFSAFVFFIINVDASAQINSKNDAPQLAIGSFEKNQPLLLMSEDKGSSWHIKTLSDIITNVTLKSISCVDANCVLVVHDHNLPEGSEYIHDLPIFLVSHDYGTTWSKTSLYTHPYEFISAHTSKVLCVEKRCIAIANYKRLFDLGVARHPLIMTSENSGDTWSYVDKIPGIDPECYTDLKKIYLHKNNYIVVGSYADKALILINKGNDNKWQIIKNIVDFPDGGESTIYDVTCTNDTCIASGVIKKAFKNTPLLLISKDNGETWQYIKNYKKFPHNYNHYDSTALYSISCSNHTCVSVGTLLQESHGYIYSRYPVLFVTYDEGNTWTYIRNIHTLPNDVTGGSINTVSCNGNICVAAGYYEHQNSVSPILIITNDGGQTWEPVTTVSNLPKYFTFQMMRISKVFCSTNNCIASGHLACEKEILPLLLLSNKEGTNWSMVQGLNNLPDDSVIKDFHYN